MRLRQGFTLIELLVVVSIIGLLLGITLPSLSAARAASKRTACKANLKGIGLGVKAYLVSNRDTFPYATSLPNPAPPTTPPTLPSMMEAFKSEIKAKEVYLCPADRNIKDPQLGGERYYDSQGTSYEWSSELNGTRVGLTGTIVLSAPTSTGAVVLHANKWPLIQDFDSFHALPTQQGSRVMLYADLHIESP